MTSPGDNVHHALVNVFAQPDPYFDPSTSSTFSRIPCNTFLHSSTCGRLSTPSWNFGQVHYCSAWGGKIIFMLEIYASEPAQHNLPHNGSSILFPNLFLSEKLLMPSSPTQIHDGLQVEMMARHLSWSKTKPTQSHELYMDCDQSYSSSNSLRQAPVKSIFLPRDHNSTLLLCLP